MVLIPSKSFLFKIQQNLTFVCNKILKHSKSFPHILFMLSHGSNTIPLVASWSLGHAHVGSYIALLMLNIYEYHIKDCPQYVCRDCIIFLFLQDHK